MEALLMKLIPLLVPIVVLVVKSMIPLIPKQFIPHIVAVCGALSGLLTGDMGGEGTQILTEMVNNSMLGLAGVGVYEMKKAPQRKKA